MMTSSNRNSLRITGLLWGESTGHLSPVDAAHTQKAFNAGFDVFFDANQNKRLNKQSRRGWLETPGYLMRRDCNIEPK